MNHLLTGLTILAVVIGIGSVLSSQDREPAKHGENVERADELEDKIAELERHIAKLQEQIDDLELNQMDIDAIDANLLESCNDQIELFGFRLDLLEDKVANHEKRFSDVCQNVVTHLFHFQVSRVALDSIVLELAKQQSNGAIMLEYLLGNEPQFSVYTHELKSAAVVTGDQIQKLLKRDEAFPNEPK